MAVIWEPELSDEARRWRDLARSLAAEHFGPLVEELDREQRYPWESVQVLVDNGLAGLFVSPDYGGQGARFDTVCAVIEELSRTCPSTGAIVTAYALGGTPLVLAGTAEQREKYLGGLAAGKAISFALTELGAGSDAAGHPDHGRAHARGLATAGREDLHRQRRGVAVLRRLRAHGSGRRNPRHLRFHGGQRRRRGGDRPL